MKPWAVVPAKSFAGAKSRLYHLSPQSRAALAQALFERVIAILEASDQLAGILVATNGDGVAAQARQRGCEVICDPVRPDDRDSNSGQLARVVDAALSSLHHRHVRAALVIMADLPLLTVDDITDLVTAMRRGEVVIAPDRNDMGTNALGLVPTLAMPTCFGHEDSFLRHCVAATERGLSIRVQRSPGLGFDVDLPTRHRAMGPI